MGFEIKYYTSDAGDIFKLRLSEETATAAGAGPAAPADDEEVPFAKMSKTNREFGLRPRIAIYEFEEETDSGLTAKAIKRVPVLTPGGSPAATVTVDGRAYEYKYTIPEDR